MEVNKKYKPIFTTDKFFIVEWGGAGSGKSESIAQRLITKIVSQPYCKPIVLRKNFNSIKDSSYAKLCKVIYNEKLHNDFHITKNPLQIIHKPTRNEFLFRGMKDEVDQEKIKSIEDPTDAWMEEVNEFSIEDFRQIRLRLRVEKGKYTDIIKQMFLSFNGIDEELWLYSELIDNPLFKNRILEINSTYKDNKFCDENYINELELLKDEDSNLYNIYTQGLRGKIDHRLKIYKNFTEDNICDYKYNGHLPIKICCDFNVDPMKWPLVQEDNGVDYVFDEIIGVDTTTEEQIQKVINKYGLKYTHYEVYGDYSGTTRKTSSKTTDYEIIKQYIPNAEFFIKPNPYVVDRLNTMNWRLCNKNKVRRLKVDRNCKHLIYDLKNAKRKKGSREEDKSDEQYTGKNPIVSLIHISSALGYYINYKYSLKAKADISYGQFI